MVVSTLDTDKQIYIHTDTDTHIHIERHRYIQADTYAYTSRQILR